MRIYGIVPESIVDGPGIRYVIFVQGCPHRCPGCHNPGSHAFNEGKEIATSTLVAEFSKNPLLQGITLSGGEPMCQATACYELAKEAKRVGLNVWLYTGYTLDDLLTESDPDRMKLLQIIDVLVDGPYKQAERSLDLRFRGSKNQRIFNMKEVMNHE